MKNVTGNVYSRGINLHDRVYKTLDETIKEESPNRFASFLRIFNASDYGIILNTNDTSDFKLDTSFISFFPRDVVSTMVHAAPVGVTYSVQCYGSKNWLFWKHDTLVANGITTMFNPAGVLIGGTPQSITRIPTIRAIVHPNDVLYFPAFYWHAVATTGGKNLMFAIRRVSGPILRASLRTAPRQLMFAWMHGARNFFSKPNDASSTKNPYADAKNRTDKAGAFGKISFLAELFDIYIFSPCAYIFSAALELPRLFGDVWSRTYHKDAEDRFDSFEDLASFGL